MDIDASLKGLPELNQTSADSSLHVQNWANIATENQRGFQTVNYAMVPISEAKDNPQIWVIDPLKDRDGFYRGYGFDENGKAVLSVLHKPIDKP